MYHKGDKVRFKDNLIRDKRYPRSHMMVKKAYEIDNECYYDLEDAITGEEYIAISEQMLMMIKKHEPKPDSEKISKNKKGGFRIRKNMFIGLWFVSCPVTLGLYIWLQSYWVFALLLIPLAVAIFGADD